MSSSSLFDPVRLGDLSLENRIFLPPLTRCRSTQPGDITNTLMAEYYAQRTQAGFLITEGTQIEPRGQGYAWTPGIYSPEQVAGWKLVTNAVHAKRQPIFAQLWHVGRVSHRALQPSHEAPIAPSAVAATGVNVFIPTGPGTGKLVPPDMPRALSIPEIHELVEMYAQAARNALSAGFDGVEIHAANGYLINQFLSERANFRTDAYGGSLSNRLRFLREVVEAVSAVVTPDRLGVRFSHCSARPRKSVSILACWRTIRRRPTRRPCACWRMRASPMSRSPKPTGIMRRKCRTPSEPVCATSSTAASCARDVTTCTKPSMCWHMDGRT